MTNNMETWNWLKFANRFKRNKKLLLFILFWKMKKIQFKMLSMVKHLLKTLIRNKLDIWSMENYQNLNQFFREVKMELFSLMIENKVSWLLWFSMLVKNKNTRINNKRLEIYCFPTWSLKIWRTLRMWIVSQMLVLSETAWIMENFR